jgi:hypothetical protein
MIIRRSFLPTLASLFLLVVPLVAHAETKILTAEATYTMGDGETPSFAEAMALQKAKQMALEQAGTYVESYTKVQNLDLTTEEIQTIAGGVLQVEVLDKSRTLIGDGLRFFVKIKATVITDKMEELAQRIKGKSVAEEYKKLQEEYARLSKDIETLKQSIAKTVPGPQRNEAIQRIQERERAFAAAQENEGTLIQRLVSGRDLVSASSDEQGQADQILEIIAQKGHVIILGEPKAKPVAAKMDHLQLVIPIRLKVAASLLPTISETAKSLGGFIWPEFEVEIHTCDRGKIDKSRSSGRETHDSIHARTGCSFVDLGHLIIGGEGMEIRTGTTNSPKVVLTFIRLAEDPYIAQYFQEMLHGLRFALQLTAAKGEDAFCILGKIPALEKKDTEKKLGEGERYLINKKSYKEWESLRRIFPIGEINREPFGNFKIRTKFSPGYSPLPSPGADSASTGYVAIVHEEAEFTVNLEAPKTTVNQIKSVTALMVLKKDTGSQLKGREFECTVFP